MRVAELPYYRSHNKRLTLLAKGVCKSNTCDGLGPNMSCMSRKAGLLVQDTLPISAEVTNQGAMCSNATYLGEVHNPWVKEGGKKVQLGKLYTTCAPLNLIH